MDMVCRVEELLRLILAAPGKLRTSGVVPAKASPDGAELISLLCAAQNRTRIRDLFAWWALWLTVSEKECGCDSQNKRRIRQLPERLVYCPQH